jgi:pimeloyl-ACP methyl ester carboxylesterase
MKPDADLSIVGVAKLVGVFLDKLDLADVTLIQNDWGGAQLLIAAGDTSRIARLVLVSCEAFDNYPPLPARLVVAAARLPGGLRAVMAMLNTRLGRRGPGAWGWLSKRSIPTEVIDEWFRPATEQPEIRRDLKKFVTSVPPKRDLRTIAEASAQFTKPVLIVWATEDKMMPLKHAYRLAEVFPDSRVVEIADSYTLVPEDQPDKLAAAIGTFLAGRPVAQ